MKKIPLQHKILSALLLAASASHSHAITTLFNDGFTGQSGAPTNWVYGNNSLAQTPGSGDSIQVLSSGGSEVLKIVDVSPYNDPTPICHTTAPLDFAATGDKVLQLNVDLKVNTNTAAYRIGLYNTAGTSSVTIGAAYQLRIFPSQTSGNVNILTYAASGVVQDNLLFTVDPADLQGLHTFSLQLDFTASTTQPTIRAYSNGKLLAEAPASASGGFRPTTTDGKIVRIMVQGTSSPGGASYELDNVTLTSFNPGALLLGSLSGNAVNRRIWGHSLETADSSYTFVNAPAANPNDSLTTGSGVWDPATNAPNPALLSRFTAGLGTKVLRYPGGCLAHGYNWKSSIGRISARARSDWKFGLDEYLRLCEQMGAEAIITCSDYVLAAELMPKHLAELVEYVNAPATPAHPWAMQRAANGHPAPYGVKYFELGNESSHGNHYLTPPRQYTAEEYAAYATDSAWAMRAVDPSIQIGLVTQPGGGQDVYCQWNSTILQLAGRAADFVVLHLYAPRFAEDDPAPEENNLMQACMAAGEQIEHHLQKYHDLITATTGRDMAVAVTEYNAIFSNTKPGVKPYRYSLASALESADLMRVFMKPQNGVFTSAYWQALNGFFGMISVSSRPAIEPMTERPAYPLYRLWGNHFGANFKNVAVTTPKAEFSGERRVGLAKGSLYEPEQYLSTLSLINYNSVPNFSGNSNLSASKSSDTLSVVFNNYSGQRWPAIGAATPPPTAGGKRVNYELTYEGRFTSTGSNIVPLDALLQDSRGWTASRSSVTVGPVLDPSWKAYQETLYTLKDAPGATVLLDLDIAAANPISGTLDIKNPKINIYTQETFPAYGLLTATASTSANGQTTYLIVFNKSNLHIPAPITLNGFTPTSAKLWEVNGPNLASTSDVKEVKSGVSLPISGSGPITYVFPAHSMTAFEFYQ